MYQKNSYRMEISRGHNLNNDPWDKNIIILSNKHALPMASMLD